MAGLINPDDVDEVRSRARIDDVVASQVTLKPAGAGTLKGLCPFHDEKTPSFQVTPARGLYYCFGCGKGGDTVDFVREINNLSFREAIEFLADKYGVRLRYTDENVKPTGASRMRLLEANATAAQFFAARLGGSDAGAGRAFLTERGFSKEVAEHFGIGFAPRGGRDLANHLRAAGFSDEELVTAGLIRSGGWDFFQGRLIWPIRDAGQAVLGFGARHLFDDDRMPAKYINTPETPVYKKSHVLYGLDLARGPIGAQSQAVVVEGYTDVMACHLAGVDTAVASCGTAFGPDHAKMIQRLMGGRASGKVIFTFDGDEAGRNAALKVFKEDALFTASTWVAIEPNGLDPCEVRMQFGDQAVRDLIAKKEELYKFVMRSILARYNLDHADARLAAVREAAPLVTAIRDQSQVDNYINELASLAGFLDPGIVRREVRGAHRKSTAPNTPPETPPPVPTASSLPAPGDRRLLAERDTIKLILQSPTLFEGDEAWNGLSERDFTHGAYRALFRTSAGLGSDRSHWPGSVIDALTHLDLKDLALQLSVEPPRAEPTPRSALEYASKLKLLTLDRDMAELKSKLQRTNPVANPEVYQEMFQEMINLEVRRKQLIRLSTGE